MQLYVHIPFCRQKCRYCAFVSFSGQESQTEKYIAFLLKEAECRKDEFSEDINTVFLGGGTPSLLSPDQMINLIGGLFSILPAEHIMEFTTEANPGTVTEQWICAAAEAGINRLSLGMQAFQPEMLNILGRIHNYSNVEESVKLSRRFGINNINLDLIFGIPGQTMKQWQETLDAALALKPSHISTYGLIPEENTPLNEELQSGLLSLPDPETEREMYDRAISMLAKYGFRQYEISNFALPGFECRHNIGYWKQIPYVGLGISAASMQISQIGKKGMICRRRANPESFSDYEQMICGSGNPAEDVFVSPSETRFETIMLRLRMAEGVIETEFREMHGTSLEKTYGKKLRMLETKGLLFHSDNSWMLTRRGLDIQNSILVELMED